MLAPRSRVVEERCGGPRCAEKKAPVPVEINFGEGGWGPTLPPRELARAASVSVASPRSIGDLFSAAAPNRVPRSLRGYRRARGPSLFVSRSAGAFVSPRFLGGSEQRDSWYRRAAGARSLSLQGAPKKTRPLGNGERILGRLQRPSL